MRIGVLTMCYNEEKVLPYFLKHYQYADEIRILYEIETSDSSAEIIKGYVNTKIIPIHMEGGIVDNIKSQMVNDEIRNMKDFDWIYVLDPDEFIYPDEHEPVREFLARQTADVIYAHMWQVYKHWTDDPLDPKKFPLGQRQHGDPNLYDETEGIYKDKNSNSIKPSVMRGGTQLSLLPGNHLFQGSVKVSEEKFRGVHWQMADYSIALDRRMARRRRISQQNLANRQGFQHFKITEEKIYELCQEHRTDPLLPIYHIPYLGFLKYISLEINDKCPLTLLHEKCPRSFDRFKDQPSVGEMGYLHFVNFVSLCMEYGFNGLITLHNYNEPMCTPDLVMDIAKRFPNMVSLWTSGYYDLPGELINSCHDVMITKYEGIPVKDYSGYENVKIQEYPLDNRTDMAPETLVDMSISRYCTRPNWEIIINNRGYLNACCGDWAGEIKFGNILTEEPMVVLHRWNRWREQMQKIQPWDTPEKQALLHSACRKCLARGTRIPMA